MNLTAVMPPTCQTGNLLSYVLGTPTFSLQIGKITVLLERIPAHRR